MLSRDYEILEEIGRGKFGVVHKCMSRKTSDIYAVKSIDKSLVSNDPIDKQSLTNEPKALSLLSLSSTSSTTCHVTRLHTLYDTPTHLHLVLDYCPNPTLHDIIQYRGRVSEPEARQFTSSLLHAVLHCHQHSVVHRDIKPENILVDLVSKRVTICDFGSAGIVLQDTELTMTEVVGTPYYVAPEVLVGRGYNEKVDEWSVGVVVYAMLAGFPPFYGESVEEVFEKVMRGNVRFPTRVFGDVSSCVKDLIRKLLCKDVSRRISALDALKHPWLTSEGHLQQ